MFELIKQDCYRYAGRLGIKEFFVNKGFQFTFFLRLSCPPLSPPIRIFCKIILRYLTIKYGYEISEKTRIAGGLALVHLGGIVINQAAIIGKNCTIYKGVTIGGAWKDGKVFAPEIGDFVWIGANATIVGKIKIGNNVLIASNSFINRDVPDNSLVIGNPAIIKPFNKINQYIQYVL
ncbi:MAG: serine acetyltransferase [Bacteroidales bacterium]|jgi:serine O-acetyltransferase|nr:serine acetyltransferase [Bacteroidales bacterium]